MTLPPGTFDVLIIVPDRYTAQARQASAPVGTKYVASYQPLYGMRVGRAEVDIPETDKTGRWWDWYNHSVLCRVGPVQRLGL